MPAIATVRRVHTRADGSCDTSDAVVHANQRAAPSVATAISVAAARQVAAEVQRPRRDRQQPADHRRGGPRPHLDGDLAAAAARCGRRRAGPGGPAPARSPRPASPCAPRTATTPARWRTPPGPPPSAARPAPAAARTGSRPARTSTIVPTKKAAGTADIAASVIDTTTTRLVALSITLSASMTTRSVSPPCATTSAGVYLLIRRGPICPWARRRLIRSICRTHHSGNQAPVQYSVGMATSSTAAIDAAGNSGLPRPSTTVRPQQRQDGAVQPEQHEHDEERHRAQAVPRIVRGQPDDLPHRARHRRSRQRRRIGLGQRVGQRLGGDLDPVGGPAVHRLDRQPPPNPASAGTAALLLASSSREAARGAPAGPASSTSPSASTTTSSQRCTEDSRCATMMPIRPRQQPIGGPLDPRLGDRVHPCGRLVEDHHVRVADQDAGEGDQLFLAGRELVTALAQPGLQAVRQARRPRSQTQFVQRPGRVGQKAGVEQRDVLGQGAGQDLGALRHDRGPPAQTLDARCRSDRCRPGTPSRAAGRPPGSAPWPASTCRSRSARSARTTGPGRKVRLTSRRAGGRPESLSPYRKVRSRTSRSPSTGGTPSAGSCRTARSSCTRLHAPSAFCSSGTIRVTCSRVPPKPSASSHTAVSRAPSM